MSRTDLKMGHYRLNGISSTNCMAHLVSYPNKVNTLLIMIPWFSTIWTWLSILLSLRFKIDIMDWRNFTIQRFYLLDYIFQKCLRNYDCFPYSTNTRTKFLLLLKSVQRQKIFLLGGVSNMDLLDTLFGPKPNKWAG